MAEEVLRPTVVQEEGMPPDGMRRIVLDMPSWFPSEKFPRWLLIAVFVLLLVAGTTALLVPYGLGWLDEDEFKTLGYPGIFLANFLGTATVFLPVPALTAAGQALIIWGSDELFVPAVVLAGASGMTLAESTAYLAGAVGRGLAEERQVHLTGRWGRLVHRAAAWVYWLMAHYGFATLLVLSAVPNPLFEFAGITAGAVRMNFWRFLTAVAIGKTIRVILLVIIGQALIDAFEL